MNLNPFSRKSSKQAQEVQTKKAQEKKQQQAEAQKEGSVLPRNPTLKTTGIETQPVSPKLDDEVFRKLHDDFPGILNASRIHPKYDSKIQDIITNDPDFHGIPTYKRPAIAHEVIVDILGLGVIARLFKIHPQITDMGYNGRFLTYKTNNNKYRYGQQPGEKADLLTPGYINRLTTKFVYNEENNAAFNAAHPIFNGEYKQLRVSMTHHSLTPLGNGSTFSLRSSKPKLALNHSNFMYNSPMFIYNVLNILMKSQANILISGITGSGKTELQKLLVGFIQPDMKIIMIEDTPETHLDVLYPHKDIMMWETSAQATLATQVANSLRNDADWCMVSETRGGEAYEMFQSVKTGHHLTTTLHASSNAAVPSRFVGMCEEAPSINVNPNTLKDDFVAFMNIGIHTDSKKIGGHLYRFIDQIAEFVPYTESKTGTHVLFQQELENRNGQCYRHWTTYAPTKHLRTLVKHNLDTGFEMPHENDMAIDQNTGRKVPADHVQFVPNPGDK